MAGQIAKPSNRIIASSTGRLSKGESILATIPCFGIYLVGNDGLSYGFSGLIFAYTNLGLEAIAGDANAFILEVADFSSRQIRIVNNVNASLNIALYSLY